MKLSSMTCNLKLVDVWGLLINIFNAITRINLYPVNDAFDFLTLVRWIVIYPVDSAIQCLNNQGLKERRSQ